MKQYVLGLDIGTTCAKATLIDNFGEIVAFKSRAYGLISKGREVEQNPNEWIVSVIETVKGVTSNIDVKNIVGISTSTQGGSTVAVDGNGNFIGNAWTWMDGRSQEENDIAVKQLGQDYIYKTTGWKSSASFDIAKLKRMKSLPEYDKAVKYYTTLEVVNGFLTGNAVIDHTNASMRLLYNINTKDWDKAILQEVGVTTDELPQIKNTGELIGKVTQNVAKLTGLCEGTAVFNGAHDQYCASIGAGVVQDGEMLLSAGTTWVLMGISKSPLFTKSFIAPGNHPIEGLKGNIVSIQGSGASLQWFKDNFLTESFEEINKEVEKRRDSCNDLFFYPYLSGANYPIWQSNVKGTFTGLTLANDKYDFVRAIMEGVAFGVLQGIKDFEKNGVKVNSITMMGGASKSDVWIKILSSVTNLPIRRLNQTENCSIGAGIIAGCGAKIFDDYESASKMIVHEEKCFMPNQDDVRYYADKFRRFEDILGNLLRCAQN